eukprot:5445701-Pleurochrysis_carterae.AAC.4
MRAGVPPWLVTVGSGSTAHSAPQPPPVFRKIKRHACARSPLLRDAKRAAPACACACVRLN